MMVHESSAQILVAQQMRYILDKLTTDEENTEDITTEEGTLEEGTTEKGITVGDIEAVATTGEGVVVYDIIPNCVSLIELMLSSALMRSNLDKPTASTTNNGILSSRSSFLSISMMSRIWAIFSDRDSLSCLLLNERLAASHNNYFLSLTCPRSK